MSTEPDYAHQSRGRSRTAIRGVFWSSLNTVVPAIATATIFIVSSRFLAPVDFGIVALAASLASLASGLAPGSFAAALIQRSEITDAHTNSVFWLCSTAAVILYLPFFFAAPQFADWLGEPLLEGLLPVIGLKILFDLAAVVPNNLIARSMRFHLVALRTAIATAVSGTVCITMLLLDYGYWALAASQVASSAVVCIAAYLAAGWWPSLAPRFDGLREIARFGIFASGNGLLNLANIDQLLLGALGGTTMLGIFAFARRLHNMLNDMIAGALASVSYALFSALQNEQEKAREAFFIVAFTSTTIAFPAFTGLALVIEDVTPAIFSEKWLPAAFPVQAFCLIGILGSIGSVEAALINSRGHADWWFVYQVLQKGFTVLAIVFFYHQGLDAVMVALAAKTLLIWPVSLRMSCKLLGTTISTYFRRAFAVPAVATLCMVPVVLAVPNLLPNLTPLFHFTLQVIASSAIYALVIVALSRDKLRQMKETLRQK